MTPWLLAAWLAVSAGAQDDAPPEQATELTEPSGSGPADSAPAGPDPEVGEDGPMIGGGEGDPLRPANPRANTNVVGVSGDGGDADAKAEGDVGVGGGDYYSAEELAAGPGADSTVGVVAGANAAKAAKTPKGKAAAKVPAKSAAKGVKVAKAPVKAEPKPKAAAPTSPLAVPLTPVAPFNP
jgi:hypothetical protein